MAGKAGRKSRVKIGLTSGGTFYTVAGIRSATVTLDGAVIDDSEFGSDWAAKLQGLKNCQISLSGNRRLDDTNGQNVLMGFFIGSTELIYVEYLPDNGTTSNVGFKIPMIVSKVGEPTTVEGAVEFTCELEGAG